MVLKNKFEVKEGRTTITIPHLDGLLTLGYPAKGPGTYFSVGKQIEQDKAPSQLYRPTTAEVVSLVYASMQHPDDKYAQEMLYIFENAYLYCFTANLWVPEGVFVVGNFDGSKLKRFVINDKDESRLRKKDLQKRLEENYKDIKFVPKGFKLGRQLPKELAKNPFIIAQAGEEGAEKLAEIASRYRVDPFIYGVEDVTEETNIKCLDKLTTLYGHDQLNFNVSCSLDDSEGFRDRSGYSFGVVK